MDQKKQAWKPKIMRKIRTHIIDGSRIADLIKYEEMEGVSMIVDRKTYVNNEKNEEFASDLLQVIKKYSLAVDPESVTKIEIKILEGEVDSPDVCSQSEIFLAGKTY